MRGLCVAMAEPTLRSHYVADELFQLLNVWKTSMLGARPEKLAVETHFEHTTGVVRNKRDRAELLGKGGEEFLRHP